MLMLILMLIFVCGLGRALRGGVGGGGDEEGEKCAEGEHRLCCRVTELVSADK